MWFSKNQTHSQTLEFHQTIGLGNLQSTKVQNPIRNFPFFNQTNKSTARVEKGQRQQEQGK